MRDFSSGHWQFASLGILRRWHHAESIVLSPIHDHRVLVHASNETWSVCRATGTRHLRRWGDIDLVPSGEEGGYDAATPYEALEIRLSPTMVDRVADETGSVGGHPKLQPRHMLRSERIGHLVRALESSGEAQTPGSPLYTHGIALAVVVELLRLTAKQNLDNRNIGRRGLSSAQLRRIFQFVESNLDQPLEIETLAREAGASSSYLRHWFKAATGQTIHRYVVRRRVERARSLLLQARMSASEIALATGFSHQSHMARWMRRELGYTPRLLQSGGRDSE